MADLMQSDSDIVRIEVFLSRSQAILTAENTLGNEESINAITLFRRFNLMILTKKLLNLY